MTFTYDATSISTDLAKVRLRVGDTIDLTAEDQSLTDEEIAYALTETSDLNAASLMCVDWLIARLRKIVDRSMDGIQASTNQRLQGMLELRDALISRARRDMAITPYCGGVSEDRNDSLHSDTDYVRGAFTDDMDDDAC